MKIAIIGAGSVGTNLHHAFEFKGIKAELVDHFGTFLTKNKRNPCIYRKKAVTLHPNWEKRLLL